MHGVELIEFCIYHSFDQLVISEEFILVLMELSELTIKLHCIKHFEESVLATVSFGFVIDLLIRI